MHELGHILENTSSTGVFKKSTEFLVKRADRGGRKVADLADLYARGYKRGQEFSFTGTGFKQPYTAKVYPSNWGTKVDNVKHSGINNGVNIFVDPSETTISLNMTEIVSMGVEELYMNCLLYTSPSPRDRQKSRMPSSA